MIDAFHNVATTGRKRGLTPVLFTQKIGEINKLVLSPGTYIMLKQVVHNDLKRYLDYIEREDIFSYMTERQICQFVSSLQPGRAIVKLANSEQKIIQFYERESVHTSHTPQVQAALNRYGNLPFQPANFGTYIGDEDLPLAATITFDEKLSGVERVRLLLGTNPEMRVCELARQAQVQASTASRVRQNFLEERRA
jgi:hypothetical protein